MRPSLIATSASNNSPPNPSAILPPRMTRSGLEVMAFHPDFDFIFAHHELSHDAVNCRTWCSGLQKSCIPRFRTWLLNSLGDERKHHRENHEHDRSAEYPMRRVLVHDPTEQQRAEDAAKIEAGGDDAERPARSPRGRCVADQHIAGRRDHAAEKSGGTNR